MQISWSICVRVCGCLCVCLSMFPSVCLVARESVSGAIVYGCVGLCVCASVWARGEQRPAPASQGLSGLRPRPRPPDAPTGTERAEGPWRRVRSADTGSQSQWVTSTLDHRSTGSKTHWITDTLDHRHAGSQIHWITVWSTGSQIHSITVTVDLWCSW